MSTEFLVFFIFSMVIIYLYMVDGKTPWGIITLPKLVPKDDDDNKPNDITPTPTIEQTPTTIETTTTNVTTMQTTTSIPPTTTLQQTSPPNTINASPSPSPTSSTTSPPSTSPINTTTTQKTTDKKKSGRFVVIRI